MSLMELYPVALSRDAFAPFGEVIETSGADSYPINEGTCERFHDLATIDVAEAGGRPLVNIFRGRGRRLPCPIAMMERHPLASQAFIPLHRRPYLVVVAGAETTPEAKDLRAFLAGGGQGVNYRRGVWHHPLLALELESDFLVIDRGGEGRNLDQVRLDPGCVLHALVDKTDI